MLLHLHVKNLALIREAEIDFSEGLNILTGETGAGKSILIGSMTMALGGKVSKEMIREDADYALAEPFRTGDSGGRRADHFVEKNFRHQEYLQTERRDCEHGGVERDFLHAH